MHLKENKMEKHAARLFPTHSIDRQQGGLGRGKTRQIITWPEKTNFPRTFQERRRRLRTAAAGKQDGATV